MKLPVFKSPFLVRVQGTLTSVSLSALSGTLFYSFREMTRMFSGNSAFETADLIYGNTDFVHLMSRYDIMLI